MLVQIFRWVGWANVRPPLIACFGLLVFVIASCGNSDEGEKSATRGASVPGVQNDVSRSSVPTPVPSKARPRSAMAPLVRNHRSKRSAAPPSTVARSHRSHDASDTKKSGNVESPVDPDKKNGPTNSSPSPAATTQDVDKVH